MFMAIKKNLFLILTIVVALEQQPMAYGATPAASASSATEDSIMDDSVRDISVVLGIGVVGAVLGLSTLSFVDSPSKHLKNIAVGGAIGIVVGVGVVIFSQATKSTTAIAVGQAELPMNAEKFATLSRQEFSEDKIAKNYLKGPDFGYNFSF